MRPVAEKYKITQRFGEGATQGIAPNPDPASGWGYYVWLYGNYQPRGHAGLDIGCPVGTPIHAIADGEVIYAGWSEDLPGAPNKIRKWLFYYNFGGILTLIQHDGWISVIAHQSNNNHVKVGQKVKEGQLIGLSGNTKTRTTKVAAHVHVEAIVDLSYRSTGGLIYGRTNPEQFFGSAAIAPQGTTIKPKPTPKEWDELATEAQIAAVVATTLTKWMESANGKRILRNAIGQSADAAMVREVLDTVQEIAKSGTNVNVAALDANAVVDALAKRLQGKEGA